MVILYNQLKLAALIFPFQKGKSNMSKNIQNSNNSEWVVLSEFARRTGKTADAVRQNINSGGQLFKFSKKFDNRIWINIRAFFDMLNDLTF